jgi:tRNA threonylcarbamoyladenosine biosynthesis protein TsaB
MRPERLLAIETSSPRLSLAVGNSHRVLKTYQGPLQWRHAENLFVGLKRLLTRVRWPVQSLTGIVVSVGPGSFTGIRIGLAVARALGQALQIPVTGVASLEAIGFAAARPGKRVCVCLDALRGEVFTGLYEQEPGGCFRRLRREIRQPLARLMKNLRVLSRQKTPIIVVGDALKTYHREFRQGLARSATHAISTDGHPRADTLLMLGAPRLKRKGPESFRQALPLYLRSAAAQERRARKR